jgi:hypothetical protein
MTTKKAKTSQAKVLFDVSKYMVSNQVEEKEVELADEKFTVTVKDLSWSRKNQLIAKAMAFGGKTEGMSFDADYYVKECLKAMIVEAPWGKTNDTFLISINDELGKALEVLVPRAFGSEDDDDENESMENLKEEPASS